MHWWSMTDGVFFLWLLGLLYVYYGTHTSQTLMKHNKNFLCFSVHSRRGSIPPLVLPLFLCPLFCCRFLFCKETRIHEWMLFWAQACDGHRGENEEDGKLAGIWHACMTCMLNHKKSIFWKTEGETELMCQRCTLAGLIRFMANNQAN